VLVVSALVTSVTSVTSALVTSVTSVVSALVATVTEEEANTNSTPSSLDPAILEAIPSPFAIDNPRTPSPTSVAAASVESDTNLLAMSNHPTPPVCVGLALETEFDAHTLSLTNNPSPVILATLVLLALLTAAPVQDPNTNPSAATADKTESVPVAHSLATNGPGAPTPSQAVEPATNPDANTALFASDPFDDPAIATTMVAVHTNSDSPTLTS